MNTSYRCRQNLITVKVVLPPEVLPRHLCDAPSDYFIQLVDDQLAGRLCQLVSRHHKDCGTSHLRSFLSFPSHRCTRSSSLITLSRPSLTSRPKIANRSFYHSAPVLWNNLPCHLRQVVHHVTPFLFLTRLCLIFQPLFSLRS